MKENGVVPEAIARFKQVLRSVILMNIRIHINKHLDPDVRQDDSV